MSRPLLPDPEPREVKYTLISVDDHLMEPPDTFEGRLPSRLQDRAPRVVESRRAATWPARGVVGLCQAYEPARAVQARFKG